MVRTQPGRRVLRRPLAVGLACSALLLTGSALRPAVASHSTVTAVQGSAFGYWADEISLFGGAQADTGPTPTVSLAPDASNSPQTAASTTGLVSYGPARLFTSDAITVESAGSLGTTGSATTTSDIRNVNYADTQPSNTGSEIFGYPPPEIDPQYINFNPQNLRTSVAGSATADGSGVSGSATITNGMVRTHAQSSTDCVEPIEINPCGRAGEAHTHEPMPSVLNPDSNPEGVVTIPANPPPNYTVAGHLHLGSTTTDYFVLVFNEQVVNPDGSITVNPVHEYFGYKLDASGNIVKDASYANGGSILHGHLYLGQVTAGVTAEPGPNAAPVAADDAYSTGYETTLNVAAPGVLANDSDPDGESLTANMPSDPANGTVTLNSDGSFSYTPDAGFSGTDSFTYMAHDSHDAMSNTATVTITVGPAPERPSADLQVVDIVDSPDPVSPVGALTYTVQVRNNGPDAASGVALMNLLSGVRGASIQSGSVAGGDGSESCTKLKGKTKGATCDLGTIAAGATETVTLNATASRKTGTITLTSGVSATGSEDPDGSNNSASEDTLVQR